MQCNTKGIYNDSRITIGIKLFVISFHSQQLFWFDIKLWHGSEITLLTLLNYFTNFYGSSNEVSAIANTSRMNSFHNFFNLLVPNYNQFVLPIITKTRLNLIDFNTMVWLKNPTRLIFDTIKNNSSKIKTLQSKNPIQPRTNSFSTHSPKPNFSSTKSIPFNHSQPIFRNSLLHNFFNQTQSKRSVFGNSKRFYYVDRPKVDHSKPRGYNKDLGNVLLSVVALIAYFAFIPPRNLETVPYTIRTEFVLLSYRLGRESGDIQYNLLKDDFKDNILPALHPESIRVQRILQDIVDALQKGLKKGQVWGELDYSPDSFGLDGQKGYGHETVKTLSERICGEEEKPGSEENWAKDEIIDEKWVEKTRKKGQEKWMKSQMAHLEGLKWEVFVVNSPMVNAFCLPGGKIVVFTGLLNHFKTDAEVATIIGHEVGHAVATHSAEQVS